MRQLSVRIPEHLYKILESKAQAMGNLRLSEALRVLLCAALENSMLEPPPNYAIKTYAMIHEAILSLVEDPNTLIDRGSHMAKQLEGQLKADPSRSTLRKHVPKS